MGQAGAVLSLDDAMAIAAQDAYLAVVATTRDDGSVQASVVNAGAVEHPVTGEQVTGLVTYGPAKLRNLRARPRIAVTWRAGWRWVTVEGTAELIGPDDPHDGLDQDQVRLLLRRVFTGAGGTHDDWDGYDRAMAEQRRTAVLIRPERIYSNPGTA
jgi:PPOX class probable F420-dependent enzyme